VRLLNEILGERTPFRLLDIVGARLSQSDEGKVNELLDAIAAQGSEGGWVVIASALCEHLDNDLTGALEASRGYIVQADIWYGCDIFGERVPGPALLAHFEESLECLASWRADENRWVRRSVGVAGHFWAKRRHGDTQFEAQARQLLDFLSPMLEDRDMDTAKGVGWALKSMGRYYPQIAGAWLEEQLLVQQRKPAAIVKRKALRFLPDEIKKKFQGG
jgi:3-methyladenine DNA glycosylase AlkD